MTYIVYLKYVSIHVFIFSFFVRMLLFRYLSMDGYFHTNAFSVKFLNHFALPDVASAAIPLLHIVSVVVSVNVTVAEQDELDKVDFVFISIQGEFTQTLH